MDKVDYLNIIEKNVRDSGQNFTQSALISAVTYSHPYTSFTVDDVTGFYAGDSIYFKDSVITHFGEIASVNTNDSKILIAGNLSTVAIGTLIKKNDAEQYLDNALLIYSKYRPLELIEEYNFDDGTEVNDLPIAWENGLSYIIKITHLTSDNVLCATDYSVELDTDNVYKLVLNYAYSGAAWMQFTALHAFNVLHIPTVPNADAFAVCDIASGYYMLALSSRFAQSVNESLGAEVVNYDLKPNQYLTLYNAYMSKAAMWLNIDVEALKTGKAVDEAYSVNQEIPEKIYDDTVLIRTNYPTLN